MRKAIPEDLVLRDREVLKYFEGGVVYRACTESGDPCLLTDESAMTAFLDEEDLRGGDLRTLYIFDDEEELVKYAQSRQWM